MKKECCISEEVRAMVLRFAHLRRTKHCTKKLLKILDLLIRDKKLSFISVKEKIGYMSKATFLNYINTFRKIGLCRRKRDMQTGEICYYFVKSSEFELTLFLLKSDFRCPFLFRKKHGLPVLEQIKVYLNNTEKSL